MKKTISRFAALVAASVIFTACPKKPNEPPIADTELQSTVDVVWATQTLTDIEMMCAFVGEAEYLNHFYRHVESTPINNQCETTRNISDRRISMVFNETPCVDQHKRSGEVRLAYELVSLNPDAHNPNYYHEFGFQGRLTLTEYRIDGWLVTTEGATLKNRLINYSWDPQKTNLEWTLEGKFNFTHPSDPSRNMTWEGKFTKVLLNTSDNAVFLDSREPAISWSKAAVGYHGSFSGLVLGNRSYNMKIDQNEMLTRDMTCSPDLRGVSVVGSDLEPEKSELHPFVKGTATFEIDGKYPRRVYFGNESNSSGPAQCDNSGEVLIKGLLYKVNFQK